MENLPPPTPVLRFSQWPPTLLGAVLIAEFTTYPLESVEWDRGEFVIVTKSGSVTIGKTAAPKHTRLNHLVHYSWDAVFPITYIDPTLH